MALSNLELLNFWCWRQNEKPSLVIKYKRKLTQAETHSTTQIWLLKFWNVSFIQELMEEIDSSFKVSPLKLNSQLLLKQIVLS